MADHIRENGPSAEDVKRAAPEDRAALAGGLRARLAAAMGRMPGTAYLEWLRDVEKPDLASGISVEIPAFEDPELQKTIKSALAMAANPGRVHFSVCLQGGTEEDAAFLESLPNCGYVRCAAEDAPGLCAARADCQGLTGDADYVLRIDSHMRFAWGWDAALIRQWQECGDQDAILTEHPLNYDTLVREPVNSDLFTKNAACGRAAVLNANHFAESAPKLRTRCLCLCESGKPVRGAFTAGGMCFLPSRASRAVPFDRDMYFVADECAMAARHFTHGHNVRHPYVRCVYHLYDRTRVLKEGGGKASRRFAPVRRGPDGLTPSEREALRLEELFGLSDDDKYGLGPGTEYGLGTARTLDEFEAFSGVSFRDFSIRRFAYEGRFDVEHGPEDMEFVDWAARKRAEGREAIPGQLTGLVLNQETLNLLKGWQKLRGTPLDILVRRAIEAYSP